MLGKGEPKIGAHGKPVLFLHPKDFCGTLVELEPPWPYLTAELATRGADGTWRAHEWVKRGILDAPGAALSASAMPSPTGIGRVTVKVAPCPSWLSTPIQPPCSSTTR